MSWLSEWLGGEKEQEAVKQQQESAKQQQQFWQDQYTGAKTSGETALKEGATSQRGMFGDVSGQMRDTFGQTGSGMRGMYGGVRGDVLGQMGTAREALGGAQGALRTQFGGMLEDVMTAGRRKAAASGLIGGGQEGGIVNPAIQRLGSTFGSQMAQNQLSFEQAGLGTMLGLGQMGMGMETNLGQMGMGMETNLGQMGMGMESGIADRSAGFYSGLAGGAMDQAGSAGQVATQTAGQVAPGVFESVIGGLGDLASIGSSIAGTGSNIGLW